MDYIVTFYKDSELVKQLNFKQDIDKARDFVSNNKKSERKKGITIAIFHGYLNVYYPYEDV